MIYALYKRAMTMRSVLVLAGIVILSAADCNVGAPIGPVDVAITDDGSLTVDLMAATSDAALTPAYQDPLEPTPISARPLIPAKTVPAVHGVTLAAGSQFGRSVAFAGDLNGGGSTVLAVGAPFDDTGGNGRGAIYLLSYNPLGVLQSTKKIAHGVDATNGTAFTENDNAPTLADTDFFGWSIANAGNLYGNGDTVLAVGSKSSLPGGMVKGTIRLMSFNTAGSLTGTTTIGSGMANGPTFSNLDNFGGSIANAGDLYGNGGTVLAVGAQGDATGGVHGGAIYLLSFDATGSLIGTVKITSGTDNGPDIVNYDNFGNSIANAGDLHGNGGTVLAVGVPTDDTGGTSRGAIYLLSFDDAGSLTGTKKIAHKVDETNEGDAPATTLAPSLANNDRFGQSIAHAGDLYGNGDTVLAVGAWGDDTGGPSRGAIYLLFFDDAGSLTATATKIASGTTNGPVLTNSSYFGASLANAGNLAGSGGRVLVVGSTGARDSPANKTGELQLLYYSRE